MPLLPSVTAKRKKMFLEKLRKFETVTHAAEAAGVRRKTVYEWRKNDPEFARAIDEVFEDVTDELEKEAHRRAKDGSDTLLIFLLKARRPAMYRENTLKLEHTGKGGGPVEVQAFAKLPEEELDKMLQEKLQRLQVSERMLLLEEKKESTE